MRSELDVLKQEFLEYLEIEKNRSPKTVSNYDYYLKRFFNESGVKDCKDLTLQSVKKFRIYLNRIENPKNPNGMSKRTQNYHMIALRTFLKYLAKMDIECLAAEKIELGKEPDREVHFLEVDELLRMMEVPLHDHRGKVVEHPSLIQLRDKALLELLFSTGLRVSEAANLKKEMVNLKNDEFTVRGKGGKLRVVFLSDAARQWLAAYFKKREDLSPYIFVSHDRAKKGREKNEQRTTGPLTPRSIERLVQKYAIAAGIVKKVTPHTMRHTYATDLLQNGADIRSVQAMLGHSSITTTQIYTHVTDKRLRETHKQFHDKKRKKSS